MPRPDGAQTWHIVTGEYPPDPGGVADYTLAVAHALADSGDRVHVWTAGDSGTARGAVTVHRVFGRFRRRDLSDAGALLDAEASGGRMLVQWVPHAFGRRGVNLPFALWLHGRSVSRAAPIDVMVHEPFMPLAGPLRQRGAAVVQRLMTATVLTAASRAFAGTPAWIRACRSVTGVPIEWTPIPSGVPVLATPDSVRRWRQRHGLAIGEKVVGCFGRAGAFQETAMEQCGTAIQQSGVKARLVLIGLGSEATAARLLRRRSDLAPLLAPTGLLDGEILSSALRGCDLMIQPYEDGVCARHSSIAALLAHGCAIVTNAGRFTEPIWIAGRAVELVQSSDRGALCDAAIRLMDDDGERARLSRAAERLYESTFDVRHTVAALKS
jgi:glycosyltransferase involved in cell wall biosynthesis